MEICLVLPMNLHCIGHNHIRYGCESGMCDDLIPGVRAGIARAEGYTRSIHLRRMMGSNEGNQEGIDSEQRRDSA